MLLPTPTASGRSSARKASDGFYVFITWMGCFCHRVSRQIGIRSGCKHVFQDRFGGMHAVESAIRSPADVVVPAKELRDFAPILARCRGVRFWSSRWQLVPTLVLFVISSTWMYRSLAISFSLGLPLVLAVPTALMLVRLFFLQHDGGHKVFFASLCSRSRSTSATPACSADRLNGEAERITRLQSLRPWAPCQEPKERSVFACHRSAIDSHPTDVPFHRPSG